MSDRNDNHWSCCPQEPIDLNVYAERNAAEHARILAKRHKFVDAAVDFVKNYGNDDE